MLDAWAECFLKGKPPEFARFFNEINILQFFVNFNTYSYRTKQFCNFLSTSIPIRIEQNSFNIKLCAFWVFLCISYLNAMVRMSL
jgi:hypothetical protein